MICSIKMRMCCHLDQVEDTYRVLKNIEFNVHDSESTCVISRFRVRLYFASYQTKAKLNIIIEHRYADDFGHKRICSSCKKNKRDWSILFHMVHSRSDWSTYVLDNRYAIWRYIPSTFLGRVYVDIWSYAKTDIFAYKNISGDLWNYVKCNILDTPANALSPAISGWCLQIIIVLSCISG